MSMSTDIETFGPAAGLTRGGFCNHFASKDALVDTVFATAMANGGDNLDRAITAAQARGSDNGRVGIPPPRPAISSVAE
jgi:AcrR family transcriptional regulator